MYLARGPNMLDVFSSIETLDLTRPDCTDHVLNISRRDQIWKYYKRGVMLVHVIMMSLGNILNKFRYFLIISCCIFCLHYLFINPSFVHF